MTESTYPSLTQGQTAVGTPSRLTRNVAGVLLLAALAFPFPVSGSLLLSHVLLIAVILLWILRSISRGSFPASAAAVTSLKLLLLLGLCILLQSFHQSPSSRFLEETVKFVILFLGAVAVSSIMGQTLWTILPLASFALSANILYTWQTAAGVYGTDRLQLEDFGSPNSLAVMIAITVLILIFSSSTSFTIRLLALTKWPLIGILVYVMLQGGSRGGFFGLAVGFAAAMLLGWPRASGRSIAKAIRIVFAVVVATFVLASILQASGYLENLLVRLDLTAENVDSGRTLIWERLLDQLGESTWAQLVGFGPGSIYLVFPYKIVVSGHSMLVTVLYYFGGVGLAGFLYWCVQVWRQALRVRDTHAPLRIGLLACLAFSSVVDNIALSTQALAACSIALAAILSDAPPSSASDPDPVLIDARA